MNASTAIVEREETAVVVSETAAILSMIERAARDPTVDIEKFERLMAMRERVENRSREDAFTAAMSATQAELPQVVRDAKNDHTKSDYATLEAISQAITPVYTKHGFSLSFGTEQSPLPGHHRIVCTASHSVGHSRQYSADLPADVAGSQGKVNKTAIQAFGSTMSYGRRYLTLLIFNVALKGEDDDGNAAGGPPPEVKRQSSAQSKRDGDWEAFQHELSECKTAVAVERLRRAYIDDQQGPYWRWSRAWRSEFGNVLDASLAEFSTGDDLKETLTDSIALEEKADNPTPVQIMAFDESKSWLQGSKDAADLEKRGKNEGYTTAIKGLTVKQRNDLRGIYKGLLKDLAPNILAAG